GNEFSSLAKKLEPSVVNITVEITEQATSRNGKQPRLHITPPEGQGQGQGPEDLFRQFFGNGGAGGGGDLDGPDEPRAAEASGTGFVVDKNGYIITNNHVVENASRIKVRLHGDTSDYRARLIGTDFETDLAVIKIDAGRALTPVTIANSESVQVGDWAVAIGSPFGLEATVTAGIVSATGRDAQAIGGGARAFQRFIQT